MHVGPSPNFLALPVADYIVCGILGVDASVQDIPMREIREKVIKVSACSRLYCLWYSGC